jgi:lysophospholipase L1-like esterase
MLELAPVAGLNFEQRLRYDCDVPQPGGRRDSFEYACGFADASGHLRSRVLSCVRSWRRFNRKELPVTRFAPFLALVAVASKATYYVSVGDSLAQGYQPIGGPLSALGVDGYAQGYANQLFKAARDRYTQLQLVKLGCGGETTLTMVVGAPWCGFPGGRSQLTLAEEFLSAHRGEIAFVTIDVGANDFFQYGDQAPATILTYLPQILAGLRTAAGPDVPIIGMSYYGVGLPAVWSATHDLSAVQAYIAQIVAFNGLLEFIYGAAGDPVADVEGAFQVTDTTLVSGTPLDVLRECPMDVGLRATAAWPRHPRELRRVRRGRAGVRGAVALAP